MDTFDLTQSGAQVQAIINDADNMKNAGSQSTVPATDGILLKDTNGQYHKIDKSSFTEAVRNTLANLLVNNDKGSTISQIAAIASGDFGSITPANLASVLGVQGGFRSHYQTIDNNATVEYTYTHGIFISTAGGSRYAIGNYNSTSPVLFSGLSANYSTTKDNANTINIYKENSKLVFQNKTGAIQHLTVAFFTPTM